MQLRLILAILISVQLLCVVVGHQTDQLPQVSAQTLMLFSGKHTFAWWQRIISPDSALRSAGVAYMECRAPTASEPEASLFGSMKRLRGFQFGITLFQHGVLQKELLTFTVDAASRGQGVEFNACIVSHFTRTDISSSGKVYLNMSQLTIVTDLGTTILVHYNPPSLLRVCLFAVAIFIMSRLLSRLLQVYSSIRCTLALKLVVCKLLAVVLLTVWTSMETRVWYEWVLTAIGVAWLCSTSAILRVLRLSTSSGFLSKAGFAAGLAMEIPLFGRAYPQMLTSIFILLMSLAGKRRYIFSDVYEREGRLLVCFYFFNCTLNAQWLLFDRNFYMLEPTEHHLAVVFYSASALLCLLILLPSGIWMRFLAYPPAKKDQEEVPNGDCAICFEELRTGHIFHGECGHMFHSQCINSWMKKMQNCPLDRKPINIVE